MGHWRSWLARFHGMEEVIGSNPICSTRINYEGTYGDMKLQIPNKVYEIAGWAGVVFVLGGYCLLAVGIIDGNSWPYHLSVLVGSIFVAAVSYRKRAYQPLALNATFSILALFALIRLAIN
jgi:hypothetical protein